MLTVFNEWVNGIELLNVGSEFVHLNDDPSFGACLFLRGEVHFRSACRWYSKAQQSLDAKVKTIKHHNSKGADRR